MDTIKKQARAAGWLYLLLAVTSIFGLVYVPSQILVPQDTAATIRNILASPTLFRLGMISNLIYLVVFVFLVLAFYSLFEEVNRKQARWMLALVLVGIPVAFLNELHQSAVLILVSGDAGGQATEVVPLHTLVKLFLSLYEYGNYMAMLFWGLWLLPLGLLVIRSAFMPRILGVFLIIGCAGYVVSSISFLLSPSVGREVFPLATIPSAIAEVLMIGWLLVKGARV